MPENNEIRKESNHSAINSPIGIFDSGYGGLTVFKEIEALLPDYDYIYLGDNARSPYGPRSFETVYEYTLQAVKWFFKKGCPLVILACNTASAKALRTIQQNDLPKSEDPSRRVLGVIRPTSEIIGKLSKTKKVGVLGTTGTIKSESYPLEIAKFWPKVTTYQQACPMWVPLIENNEHQGAGADFFVELYLNQLFTQSFDIDTLLLGCTHYPLLESKIRQYLPERVQVISQGPIVAESLKKYLQRHPEMRKRLSKTGKRRFFTTDNAKDFQQHASIFLGRKIRASTVHL